MGDKQRAIIGHFTIGKTLWKVDTTVNNGPWTVRMQYMYCPRMLVEPSPTRYCGATTMRAAQTCV